MDLINFLRAALPGPALRLRISPVRVMPVANLSRAVVEQLKKKEKEWLWFKIHLVIAHKVEIQDRVGGFGWADEAICAAKKQAEALWGFTVKHGTMYGCFWRIAN